MGAIAWRRLALKKGDGIVSKERGGPNAATGAKPAVVIMAAGKGTRLKSKRPKVLHEIGGRALLLHVITAAKQVVPASHIFCIIGHESDRVRAAAEHTGVQFVLQPEQRGTGHAMQMLKAEFELSGASLPQ